MEYVLGTSQKWANRRYLLLETRNELREVILPLPVEGAYTEKCAVLGISESWQNLGKVLAKFALFRLNSLTKR